MPLMPEFDHNLDLLPAGPEPTEDGLALEDDPTAVALAAEEQDPAPLGRSWAFDMGAERFSLHGARPQETRGLATLLGWIDKFLHSEKGALAVHPPWFGMTDPYSLFGRPVSELSVGDLQRDLEDMTNHPNIAGIADVELITDLLDEAATLELSILTDPPPEDAELLTLRMRVGVGV
jgi:hypothetical protein